jgi:phage-related minor tail protein
MDDLDSIAGTLETSLENVFMSAIDGADSFKDTVRQTAVSVVRELYRVLVVQRMVNAAMGFFGVSPAPTGGGGGGRAAGGPVEAGRAYTVGEHGRELFVPSSAGRILSVPQAKAAMGGGDGVVVHQTINVTTGVQQTVRNEIQSLMPQIAESAKTAVADARQRGGSYRRAFS